MTQEQIDELAGRSWESANEFYRDRGGVNPTAFSLGFKAGYAAAPAYKGDEGRQILQELVYLKSIKDSDEYKEEYERRKPLAWAAAKKFVAATPTQPNSVQQNKKNNNEMD